MIAHILCGAFFIALGLAFAALAVAFIHDKHHTYELPIVPILCSLAFATLALVMLLIGTFYFYESWQCRAIFASGAMWADEVCRKAVLTDWFGAQR